MGDGWTVGPTPLVAATRLASRWGLSRLYLKNEAVNPSGSFKDRGAQVAVRAARAEGYQAILTASSGNAGAATAALAARAGLRSIILADPLIPAVKLSQVRAYGAEVRLQAGLFDRPADVFIAQLRQYAEEHQAYLAFYWEPVNAAIIKGLEVIAEEIVAQLGRGPDVVLIPTGGGDHLVAQWRAYVRLWRAGSMAAFPLLVAVQPEDACPLVDAVERNLPTVPYRPHPRTAASGLRVAFSGDHALSAIRDRTGLAPGRSHLAVRVEEARIAEAVRLLGSLEGLWVEPSGAAGLAALPTLLDQGVIRPESLVVAPLTGAGWKDPLA